MLYHNTINVLVIVVLVLLHGIKGYPQERADEIVKKVRGRYVPELFGADRGKYVPDESGKYRHIKVPYDGGYGDRGEKYKPDTFQYINTQTRQRRPPEQQLALGRDDHLRFMIDFNYNGTGWQILQFEWVRDGDEERHYKYINENKLWNDQECVEGHAADNSHECIDDPAVVADQGKEAYGDEVPEQDNPNTNVHVDGEYEQNNYNVQYTNDNEQNGPQPNEIQDTIREVLEYIQTHILPTLN